jgi:hypothetical protein
MDKDDEKEKFKFPKGYEHLEEDVKNAQQSIDQIDSKINDLKEAKPEPPKLKPKNQMFSMPEPSAEHKIKTLEHQKGEVQKGAWDKIDNGVKGADPKDAKAVRDHARERIYPNKLKGKDEATLEKAQKEPKDIEKSQDFMDAKKHSLSERYSKSLSSGKEQDKTANKNMSEIKENSKSISKDDR